MWINHKVKGVWNVSENVAKAMIKAGDAVACDKRGNPVNKSAPKAGPKPRDARTKKEN